MEGNIGDFAAEDLMLSTGVITTHKRFESRRPGEPGMDWKLQCPMKSNKLRMVTCFLMVVCARGSQETLTWRIPGKYTYYKGTKLQLLYVYGTLHATCVWSDHRILRTTRRTDTQRVLCGSTSVGKQAREVREVRKPAHAYASPTIGSRKQVKAVL
ncbi:hypothetical protein AcV7_003268 [Taiwanofungus camphoratus]|nr:hypothetical protein AcV7_003268 [Antrodia cinnamomea]